MSQDLAPSLAPSYPPSAELARNARVSGRAAYDRLVAEADADPQAFWGRLAREFVAWKRPFTRVLDESRAPFYEWFNDGTLNASWNCLERNIQRGLGERTALIFEADDGAVTQVTYAQLLVRVNRLANALRSLGVGKGDRVVIYMAMSINPCTTPTTPRFFPYATASAPAAWCCPARAAGC